MSAIGANDLITKAYFFVYTHQHPIKMVELTDPMATQAKSFMTMIAAGLFVPESRISNAVSHYKAMTLHPQHLSDLRHFERQASVLELGVKNLRHPGSLCRAMR